MLEVEMGNNTGTAKESWEGLEDEDEEGMDGGNEDKDKSKDKGEDIGEALVSAYCFNTIVC